MATMMLRRGSRAFERLRSRSNRLCQHQDGGAVERANAESVVYIAGSQPTQLCELHGGHGPATAVGSFLSHIFGGGSPKPPQPNAPNGVAGQPGQTAQSSDPNGAQPATATEKKKGPLQKIFGIFGGKKKKDPDKPDRDKGDSP